MFSATPMAATASSHSQPVNAMPASPTTTPTEVQTSVTRCRASASTAIDRCTLATPNITQANSPVGGARAQAHLKLVFDSTLSRIHMCHEMMIAGVEQKFDEHLRLADEPSQARIKRHLADFIQFIG